MSDELDLARAFVISAVGGDVMATSVLKSYRNVISRLPDATHPPGPLKTTNTIFQVPTGKTWLLLRLWARAVEVNKPLSSFVIYKTRSDGSVPMSLLGAAPTTLPMDTLTGLMSQFQNLVFDNEEMLQLVVDGPNDVVVVTQYEISVLEITPV